MAGIWDYPDINELESFISQLTLQAAETVSEQVRTEAAFVEDLSLRKVLIIEEWGEGTANFGEDTLETVLFFNFQGPQDAFDDVTDALLARMQLDIQEGEIVVPPNLSEGTGGINFVAVNIENLNDILFQMATSDLELVFDLTELVAIDLKEGTPPDQYPRIPLEELVDTDDEELEEETEVDEETPDIPDIAITEAPPLPEAMLPDIEEAGPEFPEINENVRPFAVDEDTLEIPAGKEEKQIEPREPFDFEIEMAMPGIQTESSIFQRTTEEIGIPVGAGTLGSSEPVGTYPRTGIYVRNYLTFRGPDYTYNIYKNLVFYSAYISGLHGINVRAGEYSSFREFMYVLDQIRERKGVALVEPFTQQQAAAAGLETVPDHPSIDGEKAPWLERRQYYDIIEENADHPAWLNAYDFLHNNSDDEDEG